MNKRYNIRVYALIVHNDHILVTDEIRYGTKMTKFPGGGLEWGEGIADALRREMMEELEQVPAWMEHFYTTDFFMASAFRAEDQIISIYYRVQLSDPEKIAVAKSQFSFAKEEEGAQIFRWISRDTLSSDTVTYPIDKHVVELLRKSWPG